MLIEEGAFSLYAASAAGLFYGIKTIESLLRNYAGALPCVEIADWAEIGLRADYLDLRTVYPSHELLLAYIAELAEYKINTLVIEYEDKLPFRQLQFLNHPELTMSVAELEALLQVAHENFIEVIPKQQSFGHLEYILKHPQYIALRETPQSIGELCPLREGSFEMMAEIIAEVIARHPNSRYMHIGCDEVWSLGACDVCPRFGTVAGSALYRLCQSTGRTGL